MADAPFGPLDAATDSGERDLERRLHDLARHAQFPATPDLAGATRRVLREQPGAREARHEAGEHTWWPRFALAAVILIVTAVGILTVSSTARETLAGWIDIPGIDFLAADDEDRVEATPASIRAWLGDAVSLDAIAADPPFAVAMPAGSLLGSPDETYLLVEREMTVVSVIYHSQDELPAIPGSDVGLLFMQFPAGPDSVWLQKALGGGTEMAIVQVSGGDALWIEGAHDLRAVPGGGGTPETRPSANVLLWNTGGITYRIEANLPRQTMIEIAQSMKPVSS